MRSPALSPLQFEWTLGAFAATLAAHMLWMPPWYALLLATLVIARWVQRRRFARAWPAWIKFPMLLAVLAVVLFEYGDFTDRRAGTAALAGFVTLKLIESERRRDGLMMLTVCLFLISVQFLFNQGILISMYMAVPTLLVFLALNEVSAPPGTRGGLISRLGAVTRELVPLLAITLPLTIFLFLSVPRMSEPLWGSPNGTSEARTGLSDEMSPGSITELLADDTPVMRVTFEGAVPANSQLYWRGPVLWNFDNLVWRSARTLQRQRQVLNGPQTGAPGDLKYQVMLEPTDRNWLFLLDLPTGFPADARRLADGQVVRSQPVLSHYVYSAASDLGASVPTGPRPQDDVIEGLQRRHDANRRTESMAKSWVAETGADREALVLRALNYFRNESFSYSLAPPPLVSADRVDEFLFDTRSGFCEHYASSFVILMRSAGVPARVVTGYQGGDFNRVGGYLVVRNSNAHAWAEVLIDGRGWVRVDPTAAVSPERVELGSASSTSSAWIDTGFMRSLRDRFDALQAWWNRAMVQFDWAQQRDFFGDLGLDPSDWRQIGAWMAGGLGVIAALTAAWFFRSSHRAVAPGERAWRRYLARMRKLGVLRGPSEGALDFGHRASAQLPQWSEMIIGISRAYADLRYAPPDSAAQARLEQSVSQFIEQSSASKGNT